MSKEENHFDFLSTNLESAINSGAFMTILTWVMRVSNVKVKIFAEQSLAKFIRSWVLTPR